MFDEFRLVGIIKEGMNGKWVERWMLTTFGKNQIIGEIEFFEMEKELDILCEELQITV